MQRKHIVLLAFLIGLYTLIQIITPVSPEILAKYHINLVQIRWLDVTIFLPLYIIWGLAFYGYSVFQFYSQSIKKYADGRALHKIVWGLIFLAIGSPVLAILTAAMKYYTAKHLHAIPAQVVITNFSAMLVTVLAMTFTYAGALNLCRLTRKRFSSSGSLTYNLAFISCSSLYTYLFINQVNANRHIPLTATTHAPYYTPTWLLVPALLIPYLIAWYLGFLSVYLIHFYKNNIPGKIYGRALNYLSYGLSLVIVTSIVQQLFVVFTGQLNKLSLGSLLIIIYLLLIIISAGYIPIAMGAKKLKTIEEA